MNYMIAGFSFLLGIYSLPFMFNVFESKHDMSNLKLYNKIVYVFSLFLFVTFPFVNFSNCLDILYFKYYIFSYVSGVYGIAFLLFSSLDSINIKKS